MDINRLLRETLELERVVLHTRKCLLILVGVSTVNAVICTINALVSNWEMLDYLTLSSSLRFLCESCLFYKAMDVVYDKVSILIETIKTSAAQNPAVQGMLEESRTNTLDGEKITNSALNS